MHRWIALALTGGHFPGCDGGGGLGVRCHAKSVAWTYHVISPAIYNVSSGFMVIWLFGQFRWFSCNKLALFSDLSDNHLLGAVLEPSLPFCVEREETLNTPYMAHTCNPRLSWYQSKTSSSSPSNRISDKNPQEKAGTSDR
jgi:hypothetical protein